MKKVILFIGVMLVVVCLYAQQQVNLMDLTIPELKALAYDEMVKMEQAQKNLQVINQAIIEKSKVMVNRGNSTVVE